MKKGQKASIDGYQCLLFPMEYMNISQGNWGTFSHNGVNALDNAGKDAGIDETIAPCDLKVKWIDCASNGNAVFLESVKPVWWADGSLDYASFMFIHDNYVEDIRSLMNKGYVFKQGETFGDEGTAGFATGELLIA